MRIEQFPHGRYGGVCILKLFNLLIVSGINTSSVGESFNILNGMLYLMGEGFRQGGQKIKFVQCYTVLYWTV